ncbi:hypothetical protein K474DRAFT_1419727 [Panus rudis PR-1116 ss-1]|nr:hypothetical protein K474DRAFT_1419727 [Panus rudis PR-1116 ss-1]
MAKTYAWVLLEQQIADMQLKNEETVRWIWEQKERDVREQIVFTVSMEDAFDDFEFGDIGKNRSGKGMEQPEDDEWRRNVERAIQEEVRRLAERRKDGEKNRASFPAGKSKGVRKERKREDTRQHEKDREQARAKAEEEAWRAYEKRWSELSNATNALTFDDIPWPVFAPPKRNEDISPGRITMFLLSPNHSKDQSRKERIKLALRRWHPDRFGRVLNRAVEQDRAKIEECAGVVVRCLNNLLEREG